MQATHAAQVMLFVYWISLPLRSHCRSFNSSHFHRLFLSPILDILSHTLTCFLRLYFLHQFFFQTPQLLVISTLQLFPVSFPPLMLVSSFLLCRLLSEMAASSSVAQLGINKHLDISLLSPSLVALFFSSHFCTHTRTTRAFCVFSL